MFVDIDECDPAQEPRFCNTQAACLNSDGSYTCTCREGFTGDGEDCDSKSNDFQLIKTSSCLF